MLSNGWTVCECEWEGVSTSPCIVARPSICTRGNNAPPNDCSFHSAHLIRDDYLYFIGTYDVSAFWGSPVARLAIPLESTPRRRRRRCEAAVCERNPWLSALYQKALAFLASDARMHAFPSQKQSNIWRTPACARKKAIRITVIRFDADNINIENNVCIVWDINFDFIWLFSICSHFFCCLFVVPVFTTQCYLVFGRIFEGKARHLACFGWIWWQFAELGTAQQINILSNLCVCVVSGFLCFHIFFESSHCTPSTHCAIW